MGSEATKAKTAKWFIEELGRRGMEVFRHRNRDTIVRLPLKDRVETLSTTSKQVGEYLTLIYRQIKDKFPDPKLVDEVAKMIHFNAMEAREVEDCLRVASFEDGVVVDLATAKGDVVVIRPDGWEVRSKSPVYFRRGRHAGALPVPTRDGDIDLLRTYLCPKDEDAWVLMLGWLLGAYSPHKGGYYIGAFSGPPGCGKTTAMRALKQLSDPTVKVTDGPNSLPRSPDDLATQANAAHTIWCDNLTKIPLLISNLLCEVSTGGSWTKRKLYSDLDEFAVSYRRPILLGSVHRVVRQPALASRTLAFTRKKLPPHSAKTEDELWDRFESEQAAILGAVFDLVSGGMRLYPKVKLDPIPRMASATTWIEACLRAGGFAENAFVTAHQRMETDQTLDALDEWPVIAPLTGKLSEGAFEGSLEVLLTDLVSRATPEDLRHPDWPKTAAMLSRALNERSEALTTFGIRGGRTSKSNRDIRAWKLELAGDEQAN